MSGFVSKWFLAQGVINTNIPIYNYLGPIVLLCSAFLTAGYLITVSISAFIPGSDFKYEDVQKQDPNFFMLIPLIILAVLCVVLGAYPTPLIKFFASIANLIM